MRISTCVYPIARAAGLAALALLVATPALAVGTIQYDGPSGFGTSAQTAMDSGVTILTGFDPTAFQNAFGLGFDRSLDPASIATGPPASASSSWQVTNEGATDLLGDLFLVFVRPLTNVIQVNGQDQAVTYVPQDVGLRLQDGPGHSWVIFEVTFDPTQNPVYYPAVSLGSLGAGQTTADPFAVNYILDNPQIFLDADEGFELGIPKWQLAKVFVPIPEPTTALLLGTGLALVAIGRRRPR